ncbi:MAG: acetyl/propionyl/methylcrotonyl-CoA carboxylase subunit alpha [Desulfobulbaceae bacterium]|nr:acetyl/propionyl/methylcrotonyl-CoA carboxylase subunit alpha [Desulfobulbaceae bacterium]
MFKKILIANRGEIACRVISTARKLGILTVAVYSDADRDALHVTMADEAVYIGPPPSRESYLVVERIIDAALRTGAEAIHPGYGFLSENAVFCRTCNENKLVFIGPPAAAIEAMGSKSAAKNIMEQAGVPLVPGYHGEDQDPSILKKVSDEMGYPVLLKATAGGGGKGMRQVWAADEFEEALTSAKREALGSFGDETMLVEKYLIQPRHVEVQVFCDQHGDAVYLAERDCSVQRRHQKVIEEAPAPGVTDALRQQMGEAATRAARAINYQGAGTVEFLLDQDGSFYFMEMNTRLQVEHPVTEMITGQDLVEWQLRVAGGEELPLAQDQIRINGHALEARIYAEDPANDFLPASGTLTFLQPPEESDHVRVDTGVLQGDEVSVYYDPMIAKLIVWDENRDKALRRLTKALAEYRISGMATNIDFLYNLVCCEAFKRAEVDTGFIEKHHDEIFLSNQQDISQGVALAALYLVLEQAKKAEISATRFPAPPDPWSPWNSTGGWRLNQAHANHFELLFQEQQYPVTIEQLGRANAVRYLIRIGDRTVHARGRIENDEFHADLDGHRLRASVGRHDNSYSLYTQDSALQFKVIEADLGDEDAGQGAGALNAPMNGTVVELTATEGGLVKKGDALLVMEAMKMEHTIRAPADGKVTQFYYQPGDLVDGGAELLDFAVDDEVSV